MPLNSLRLMLKTSKSNRTLASYSMFYRQSLSRILLTLLACVLVFLFLSSSSSTTNQADDPTSSTNIRYHASYRSSPNKLVTPPLTPQAQRIHDIVLYYMLPIDDSPKGILFFFHGCNHSGQDTFMLPEDRIIALAALNRGLAVVSMTSQDRSSGCWSSRDAELMQEQNVVGKWMQNIGLSLNLPRIGMGVSSGGAFLFYIYKHLKLSSMASYVSPRAFTEEELSMHSETALPATIYVHMPRDKKTASKVESSYKRLREAGIPTSVIAIPPHPFTPELCTSRLPELGDLRCTVLFRAIEKQKDPQLLDPRDYTVLESNRHSGWESVLAPFDKDASKPKLRASQQDPTTGSDLLSPTSFSGHSWLYAAVDEEIAVSYGRHETTAERRSEVLDFLMKHAGLDVDNNR